MKNIVLLALFMTTYLFASSPEDSTLDSEFDYNMQGTMELGGPPDCFIGQDVVDPFPDLGVEGLAFRNKAAKECYQLLTLKLP